MTFLTKIEKIINELEHQNFILIQQLEQAKKAIDELKNSNIDSNKKKN